MTEQNHVLPANTKNNVVERKISICDQKKNQAYQRQRDILNMNRLRSLIRSSSNISESELKRIMAENYKSVLNMIPLDNIAAPIISEDDSIKEVLRNGLVVNGIEFTACAKTKQYHNTVNMTRMLVQRLCDQTNHYHKKSRLNSKDLFRDIMVRSSKSAGAIEAKHILSVLLLKNNPDMKLQIIDSKTKNRRIPLCSNSGNSIIKPRLEIFAGEGSVHCTIQMVFYCEIKQIGKDSLIRKHQRRQNNSIEEEGRDEVNESTFLADNRRVVDFMAIMHERLAFSQGNVASVRKMRVEIANA